MAVITVNAHADVAQDDVASVGHSWQGRLESTGLDQDRLFLYAADLPTPSRVCSFMIGCCCGTQCLIGTLETLASSWTDAQDKLSLSSCSPQTLVVR